MIAPAEKIRYCRTCPKDRPTILNSWTVAKGYDQCSSCQEKAFFSSLKLPEIKVQLCLATLPKNVCHNCGRSKKVVTLFEKKRLGEVYCHTCRKSLRDPAALAECRRKLKGKGRLHPGRAGKV